MKNLRYFAILALAAAAYASGTAAWEVSTYQDFIRGRFQGVSLSRDGRLTLAPKIDAVFSSDQPVVWSVAQAADGTIYAATGHRGRLYRVDRGGQSSVVWTAEQSEIFALAVDAAGAVYAATSPDGKVYRIENGKAAEYFAPKSKYIWSLAFAPDGALYVGTGDEGKVFRVTAAGKGELYYATGQAHVTGLAVDRDGRLLAGTEPNGILYRVTAQDKAFVLYDANLPEIRSILPQADGSIYAVAMGGSLAKRMQGAQPGTQTPAAGQAVAVSSTSISVTAEATQAGPEIKPPEQPKQPQAGAAAPAPQAQQSTPLVDMTGVEKSAVYKINADNTVETLWSSKEENVYDVLPLAGQLLFSTDNNGRIYHLSPDHKLTLVVQTNEGEATRLLRSGASVLAATANMGRIYRMGDEAGLSGVYESQVHDAGTVAQWGRLSWRGQTAAGATLVFRTRSGNSQRPDKTWSDWSEPITEAAGARIPSPNARYIQWKAEFAGARGAAPILDSATVAYLPQNTAPIVKSITVAALMAATAAGRQPPQQSTAVYSITVTDSGDALPAVSAGTPTQTLSRAAAQQIQIAWQAEDADGDRLAYNLSFRGEGEQEWKLLKANTHDTTFAVDGDALADGKYFFKVTASDREANPPASAREAELVSAPVWIDTTPPVITVAASRRAGAGIEVEFTAADTASPLRRCEYSLDAGNWTPVEAADGVIDSLQEKFVLRLASVPPGEHVLVLRTVDSANNAGLAKVVLR
ncbi:MAG: hypothetical protein HYX25_10145 [Candidatus Solibacter usitatus]|nr:hypothetical protein [Candidatus Solibacter usitatus]